MKAPSLMKFLLAALMALGLCLVVQAQVVTSGLTGLVRDRTGKGLTGATVTVVHVPTGTSFTATTSETGRYNLRGLPTGGPYTVSVAATGYKGAERRDLETELGADTDVSFTLDAAPSEIVTLDKFVVQGQTNELDSSAAGAGNVFNSTRLEAKPTTQRSFADMISQSPFVTMRSQSAANDREEQHISAVGQNNRYNSIQIDGSRINDQFGLNGHGMASFFNPISLDTLEQLSVQISPYDVRQAGFTGASINAVTKSGTNTLHGSGYYYFSGDHLAGFRMQGEDVNTRITTGRVVIPKLERITKGLTLGGPLWKDHVFFFFNWEKFSRTQAPVQAGLPGVDQTQLSSILARFAKYDTDSGKSIDWGQLGGSSDNTSREEKYLGKVDWNIVSGQRLTVRYSQTKGAVPQFGSFTSTSLTNTSVTPSLTASGLTALTSNFYAQTRVEKNLTTSLVSKWSPNFNTEIRFGTIQQDQLTPVNAVAPEIDIYGVSGTDRNGRSITSGGLIAGTDLFRQGNQIFVDTKQYLVTGDYFLNNFVISGGVEREANDFFNLFRQSSYGQIAFASVADFLNDNPARITRNYLDTSKRPLADLSDFTTTGIFGQVKWNVNPRLSLTAGIRYEYNEQKLKPALNQQLLSDSGLRNDGTLDGADYISPRLAFNWSVDEERIMQIRGGAGHFLGRAPWVFFSNSFGSTGVGNFTIANNGVAASGTFTNYLRGFDVNNPIATGADLPGLRREVDFADPGIKLPSVYRLNFGVDRRLPILDSTLTFEAVRTIAEDTIFITNENIRPTTVGADGRQRYAGNPSTAANARYPNFIDLYRLRNVKAGGSTYVSLALSRPMKNKWGFDLSYTRGRATEAQAFGQTTAGGQWFRNVIFNQSVVEVATADFETKDRVQLSIAREFEPIKKHRTRVSLYYEGRTGNPFSWIYSNDLNGDGQSNDVVAVPSGATDPRFNFSGMTADQLQAYLDFMNKSGLAKYAGGYAPKNAFTQPWVNRLDLHVSQEIPLHFREARVEVFADWINFGAFIDHHFFGYYEEAFRLTNDVFRRQFIGPAVYDSAGKIVPQKTSATAATSSTLAPDSFIFDNSQSRWRIQLGARVKF